ncbi:MAG: ribosome maturation factor RimM [Bacteroidales bacterium]
MEHKDFYFLGKIIKTSGYKGSLVFFFDVDDLPYYNDLEAVFIEVGGGLIPFAIKNLTLKTGNTAFVSLEDIETEEQALALVGCKLYLPDSFLPKLTGNKFYFHEVHGFHVVDNNHGKLGIIDKVYDHGAQALLSVKNKSKEILIPVADEIIQHVDHKKKIITVDLPEGFLEIYM